MAKILIVDDNPDILDALDLLLHLHQFEVVTATNTKDALFAIQHQSIDLMLQDMNFTAEMTTGEEGRSLFYQVKQLSPQLPIILMTAWTQLECAVELVKAGAVDYVPKPWDDEKLLNVIKEHCAVHSQANNAIADDTLIYKSQVMENLVRQAEKVALSEVNVLITGPNGSGKEKLTDYIHKYSNRGERKCLKVNIGALPETLMEAELFGAEKGAFSGANNHRIGRFEEADGGTLFLDEIGNLSLTGQAKLLRVLQTGEFERLGSNKTIKTNVRIICATNANLSKMVAQGQFREDLLFRLNVIELTIPALKDRVEDIPLLANLFVGTEYKISEEAHASIASYSWPGNVRELQNACLRATVFAKNNLITPDDFALNSAEPSLINEEQKIVNALKEHNWVIKQAAEYLGLSRQSLYRRMQKYNINTPS